MYNDYRVVVNTAAGRRRYMQYLIPYVVSSGIVDRYDIWVNTHNGADIEFFEQVAAQFPVVNLVWQPDGVVNGNASINAFYKDCVESDTIYFKLDDDIIWMEPGLIEKMVKFRLDNPHYFLVTPLVINNALSTYMLEMDGKIKLDAYYNSSASHPFLWRSGIFARELHEWFLDKYLKTGKWDTLHVGRKEMGMTRFSINAVLWFGDEMRKFGGVVPGDDEEFLSCIYPTRRGVSNAWNGDAIVAHFAFFTQREQLDKAQILEKYGEVCRSQAMTDSRFAESFSEVGRILDAVNTHGPELMQRESPYRSVANPKTLRSKVKKLLPSWVLDFKSVLNGKKEQQRGGFIIE
ncbi:uncharacterized protein BN773_01134 [Prevotella sp. CAG:755]|nr:uncharacterized protein BN773_01134 [Prevotella sp. CAG:755]